jgi:hypothetical protein
LCIWATGTWTSFPLHPFTQACYKKGYKSSTMEPDELLETCYLMLEFLVLTFLFFFLFIYLFNFFFFRIVHDNVVRSHMHIYSHSFGNYISNIGPESLLYSYNKSFSGFAVKLTEQEAQKMAGQ